MKKECENCKMYRYKSNILGGVAECMRDVKPLNVFVENPACDKWEEIH